MRQPLRGAPGKEAGGAALKLAEYYEGYEVLVCTHTDREHIHSHFLINSVNFDTGRKLHVAKEQLPELRQRNDQVCMEFSLPVFQPREQKQKTKTMTIGEYHTAARGQSKKLQLMNIINDCMRHASNRDEFIALMESEGYKVRWEDSRRNITYTTPSGWQCRDRLLFGDKYLKENMEYEFRIRDFCWRSMHTIMVLKMPSFWPTMDTPVPTSSGPPGRRSRR